MFKGIDLSSDTATKPTAAMKQAMMNAEVGDEQKGEDPTTKKLEEMIAEMLGFNAAIFLPSATMANQIAIQALSEPGNELLAAENAHIFTSESGGPAIHAQVICRPIRSTTGKFTAEDIQQNFRWMKGIRYPISKLLSIENTVNAGGGVAWTANELQTVINCAKKMQLKLHLDGARLFNAAIKTGMPPMQISKDFDTVTICLSKGLGCPMGALLVFDKNHFEKISRLKHLMGGAMRQSGIMAAAGIYALQHHITRMQQDHENAQYLAQLLTEIPQIRVLNNPPETNMVFFEWNSNQITSQQFLESCLKKGVRFSQTGINRFRAVTHLDIKQEDIKKAVEIAKISINDTYILNGVKLVS